MVGSLIYLLGALALYYLILQNQFYKTPYFDIGKCFNKGFYNIEMKNDSLF